MSLSTMKQQQAPTINEIDQFSAKPVNLQHQLLNPVNPSPQIIITQFGETIDGNIADDDDVTDSGKTSVSLDVQGTDLELPVVPEAKSDDDHLDGKQPSQLQVRIIHTYRLN